MPRTPLPFSLPPFRGMTRRLILTIAIAYLGLKLTEIVNQQTGGLLENLLLFYPHNVVSPFFWTIFTYPFVNLELLPVLLACLSLWFFAAALEQERGPLWLAEYFVASTAGGALLLTAVSYAFFRNNTHGLDPGSHAFGVWPAVFAMLLAYGYFHPNEEISFNFLFRIRAKYLVAIYFFVYLAMTLSKEVPLHSALVICGGIAGYAFLRLSPRRGFRYAMSERWYGLRNAYYRRKRQQAAKKFTVYMKQQGRDVHFDASGHYVGDDERRDPKDKRWMN